MSILGHLCSPSGKALSAVPVEPIFRLSVEQYHAMGHAGILTEDDAVELLEGWLVFKMTKSPEHCISVRYSREALAAILPDGWHAVAQDPVTTADSEPEPDVGVVRGKMSDYAHRHPGPADVGMLVEVADSSLERDRGIKKRVYANARVPVYWIVNVVERTVEVYSEPIGTGEEAGYAQRKDHGADDEVPVILDGREIGRIRVRDLLP